MYIVWDILYITYNEMKPPWNNTKNAPGPIIVTSHTGKATVWPTAFLRLTTKSLKALHNWPFVKGINWNPFRCDDSIMRVSLQSEGNAYHQYIWTIPDSKVHGANMGPIWGRQDPGGPHVGPMNFAIWNICFRYKEWFVITRLMNTSFNLLKCVKRLRLYNARLAVNLLFIG